MYGDFQCADCSIAGETAPQDGLPSDSAGIGRGLLSVVILFDYPFDVQALDEALFSVAVQDWDRIEVVVALPDVGLQPRRDVEAAILSQHWPAMTPWKIVSVSAPSQRTISANLMSAGLFHATGRYVAFLHHQDIIYHHAYKSLIGRLDESDAVVAFGGVRLARHACGPRHWHVLTKQAVRASVSRLTHLIDGPAAVHRFVVDRHRLSPDDIRFDNPASSLATNVFLLRLALHPKADFSLATNPVCESRHFPHSSSQGDANENGRLPAPERMLGALRDGQLVLRDTAISPNILLAEIMATLLPG